MPVIPLTIVASLCLVFTFVVFYLSEHARGRASSVERDSLLPFNEEGRRRANHAGPDGADDGASLRPPAPRRTARVPHDR